MTTLRDSWPERGAMISPESPVGLTPLGSRPDEPHEGDTWFGPGGNTVWIRSQGRDILWVNGDTR